MADEARTVVLRSWDPDDERELLVTIWPTGQLQVAEREREGATWGPPWTVRIDNAGRTGVFA